MNPFPGPQPYRAAERARFFGRDAMVRKLCNQVLARPGRSERPILIYLDQMEQLFVAEHAEEEMRALVLGLDALAQPEHRDVHLVLRGYEGEVWSAAWSPDGKRIVTASKDNTARVWLIDVTLLQQALRDATTDCLTLDQRETYLAETESDARKAYEGCERSHRRTPRFGAAITP